MKRAREQPLEPLPGLRWAEQSKEEPTKHPNSRRFRPLHSNNSRRKLKQRPHTNRASTRLNEASVHVWTLADIQLSSTLGLGPDKLGLLDTYATP